MSDEISKSELVIGERKFLHDISNQLVVAQGMGSFVSKVLKKREDADPKELERMEKTMKAIGNIIDMVKNRRTILHSQSDDTE